MCECECVNYINLNSFFVSRSIFFYCFHFMKTLYRLLYSSETPIVFSSSILYVNFLFISNIFLLYNFGNSFLLYRLVLVVEWRSLIRASSFFYTSSILCMFVCNFIVYLCCVVVFLLYFFLKIFLVISTILPQITMCISLHVKYVFINHNNIF